MMTGEWIVLLIHAAATWAMTGLIWFVQVVHYPLFGRVAGDKFPEYERAHQRLTTAIVAPLMLAELICATWLALDRPPGVSAWLGWLGLAMLAGIWLSTFAVQVPLHRRLERRHDPVTVRSLVRTNWVRTVLWTTRGIIALMMLVHAKA